MLGASWAFLVVQRRICEINQCTYVCWRRSAAFFYLCRGTTRRCRLRSQRHHSGWPYKLHTVPVTSRFLEHCAEGLLSQALGGLWSGGAAVLLQVRFSSPSRHALKLRLQPESQPKDFCSMFCVRSAAAHCILEGPAVKHLDREDSNAVFLSCHHSAESITFVSKVTTRARHVLLPYPLLQGSSETAVLTLISTPCLAQGARTWGFVSAAGSGQ